MSDQDSQETERVYALAEERGYVIEEHPVEIGDGQTRPGWLIFDLACNSFAWGTVNWTDIAQVEAHILENSD